jgi:DNA invertase Pin-like site-specific DNA recombinase
MTTAILYARFSPRPRAEECESVEMQLDRCRAFCAGLGYRVLSEHSDKDRSGARADNRPGLQAAIHAACSARGVLVVYSLSRLARNVDDARAIAKQLQRCGAELAMLRESIDTSTPMGKAFFTIMAVFDELEREQTAVRTSDAMLRHQGAGRRMSRLDRCPYGTQPDPADLDRLIENPAEAAVLRQIEEMRASGHGSKAIAARLNALGAPCRASRWHHSTIRKILARSVSA